MAKDSEMTTTRPPSDGDDDNRITILGFGSLLSETSARTTFPKLSNFRLGRVPNYRRVFGHPAPIFFQRGIANMETLEISPLAAFPEKGHSGFICSVFEVDNDNMIEGGVPSKDFLEREEEFDIVTVPYHDFKLDKVSNAILCTKSSDEDYLKRWGSEHFQSQYGQHGISTIWGWGKDSGLRPCAVYLRHCALAAKSMGPDCYASFLDETFLVDQTTTIRQYLEQHPEVMSNEPPPELASRYGG